MPLTLAEIDALLPDNTAGDISPADHRATMAAVYGGGPFWMPATVGAFDDYFDEDNSADWTAVNGATWAYNYAARLGHYRGAHVRTSSLADNLFAGYVKSLSGFTTGDYIQSALSFGGGPFETDWYFGIVLANGVLGTSNMVGINWYTDANASGKLRSIEGTFNSGVGNDVDLFVGQLSSAFPVHIRLTMVSTTSYTVGMCYSGETADFQTVGTITVTALTPTHGGFICGEQIATPQFGLAHYFHSNA